MTYMERLKNSQEKLVQAYNAYQLVSTKALAPLDVNDKVELTKLLDVEIKRVSLASIQKTKTPKESDLLRSAIADVLLLLDGFDIKEIKAKMNAEAEV
mgnify:CR=1 FL=1